MLREYFWQDLWLRFWWEFSEAPKSLVIFFLFGAMYFYYSIYTRHKYDGLGFSIMDSLDRLSLFLIIFNTIFFLITVSSPLVYPHVFVNSPNSPFKEELRTATIVRDSTVWIIKRNDYNEPIDVEEYVVFSKTTDSVIAIQSFTNDDIQNGTMELVNFPLNECYTSKEEAEAVIEDESEEEK